VIIPGIPLVPEDVRNPDVFGATGDALGAQQAGQSLVVAGQQAERRVVLRAHGQAGGRAHILSELIKIPVAITAAVRFWFEFSHLTIAAPGVLPWYFGSARSFLNFSSCAARPTPPIVFMAMVPMSFFFATSIHS
jgi:hypothetical protein